MPKRFSKVLRRIGISICVLGVVLIVLQTSVSAQSNLGPRVSRLEAENSTLRSRVSRLETQLSRVDRASGVNIPAPEPESRTPAAPASSDPMFDRLATLAIEQRERMDRLEGRLSALEARFR